MSGLWRCTKPAFESTEDGYYDRTGSESPASIRGVDASPSFNHDAFGFRITLYL